MFEGSCIASNAKTLKHKKESPEMNEEIYMNKKKTIDDYLQCIIENKVNLQT